MKKNKIFNLIFIFILCFFTFNIKVNATNLDNKTSDYEVKFIEQKDYSKIGINVEDDGEVYSTCEELFGESFFQYLNDSVFKIIWIGVPLLLILLTSFDFAKVVFGDSKDGMQNAFNRFKKRAIVSVLIFLTPTIILTIANLIDPGDKTIQDCVRTIKNMNKSYIIVNTNLLK